MAEGVGGGSFGAANQNILFGDGNSEACDDCTSVTSPCAYFVELLGFLRLDPENSSSGKLGIQGTVLGKLFARRPDLGDLELSCKNTLTILPYLDLRHQRSAFIGAPGVKFAPPSHNGISLYSLSFRHSSLILTQCYS